MKKLYIIFAALFTLITTDASATARNTQEKFDKIKGQWFDNKGTWYSMLETAEELPDVAKAAKAKIDGLSANCKRQNAANDIRCIDAIEAAYKAADDYFTKAQSHRLELTTGILNRVKALTALEARNAQNAPLMGAITRAKTACDENLEPEVNKKACLDNLAAAEKLAVAILPATIAAGERKVPQSARPGGVQSAPKRMGLTDKGRTSNAGRSGTGQGSNQ
jgi:hypothetical protein